VGSWIWVSGGALPTLARRSMVLQPAIAAVSVRMVAILKVFIAFGPN
jgi:hypothetical protein